MIVKPFRALRPRADLATKIPSYPYDVVNRDEARQLAADDPYSFLHVVRAEIDLAPDVGPYDDRVYERSRQNFRSMIEQGWLVREQSPAFYVYRLRMDRHTQTGIVGAAAVDDYLGGRIKKHEHTRPAKEDDRVRVIQALGAHPGPVFLTYPPDGELNDAVTGVAEGEPAVRFTAPDGIEHELWVVADPTVCERIEGRFGQMPATYVADGHHRTAAAARACEALRGELQTPAGDESCNYFLAVHFPADEVRVLDYNRVVRDLNGLTPETLLGRLRDAGFEITADHAGKRPPRAATFGMYVDRRWYLLSARPETLPADTLSRLDVSLLSERVLGPLLGIDDPRTDSRIDFVGGIRGMEELERRVDGGDAAVAFALYPTSLDDLMIVADANQVMPPKSTWFEPKLRSGMVIQPLDTTPL
jgi:uncharacterized protein (DUF1015 family)